MVPLPMPDAASSASFIWECVVVAGWMTSDLTSATFARSEKSFRWSMKRNAASCPPTMSKVKIDTPPCGKYRS